ncbi:class I SAM-dependent methyltransferase [Nonomuraea coxensis]|uniref:class I SAM-dependent methyltransferase n=1 Tax=Nonomuraea coxensis TaxID=404386 RepID=UPI0003AA81A8|nr:class I SAM-dependent methyltransferase [Nonomuraea coxensis]
MVNAEMYDRGFARLTRHTVAPLLARSHGARRLLDVGCGSGVVTEAALALGAEVTAVDADPAMAELTARRFPGAAVLRAALPGLPFGDGAFDAVAGNFLINHVPDTAASLRELRRVLRPGGTLALSWWKAGEMTATAVLSDAMDAAGLAPAAPPRPFAADADPERFAALLAAAGFAGAEVESVRWRHRVDLDTWWTDVVGAGGVRFGTIARQPPAVTGRVRAHYERLAAPYARDGFPVCAHIAHAHHP